MRSSHPGSVVAVVLMSAVATLGACGADGEGSPPAPSAASSGPDIGGTPRVHTGPTRPDVDPTSTVTSIVQPTTLDAFLLDTTGLATVPDDFTPAAVPDSALPVEQVIPDATDAVVQAAIAELEAGTSADEIVVFGIATGCVPMVAWALPERTVVTLGVEFHPAILCARATDYAVLAVIPIAGTNTTGSWDYHDTPPEVVVNLGSGAYEQ